MTDSGDRATGIGRTSLVASAGTLGATVVGFGRTLALAAAIGTGLVADSYTIANQVPTQVFLLLGGGAIFFVFVPQIMRHARTSKERGDEYGSLLLFAGAAFGILVTIFLLAISPLAIRIMGGSSWGDAQASLGLRLSFWCIPQIIFYSLNAIVSQLMNARGRFVAVAWIPTVSSLVIISACIPIVVVGTIQANSPDSMDPWEVKLLGGTTLFGAALQATLLIMLLRRTGFRLRVRFQLRGLGLRATASLGLITLASVACFQIANIVTAALSTQAGSAAKNMGIDGRGYTAMFYAQTLLYVAAAVASTSLASVLLQRLSQHYAEQDHVTASRELNEAILAIGALLIPVTSIFVCLGPLGTELLFARGETNAAAAHYIGVILAVLSAGLIPYTLHDLLIRPFYAVHDAKTPLRSGLVIGTVWVLGAFIASLALPPEHVLVGIAGSFVLSYVVDLPLKLRTMNKRLEFRISNAVIRGYLTALPAGVVAALIVGTSTALLQQVIPPHWIYRALLLVLGVAGFAAIYYPLTSKSSASLRQLLNWLRN